MVHGRNDRALASRGAYAAGTLALLLGLGCTLQESESSDRDDDPIESPSADQRAEAEPSPPTAGAQMALQRQPEPSGQATDPVAEQAERRVRAVDPSELEPLPSDPAPSLDAEDADGQDVQPIAYRIARQSLTVRDQPNPRAALRGRIPMTEAFEVFAFVDGQGEDRGCGGLGWAEIGGGYVCLERSRKAAGKRPRILPRLRDRGLTPYYYAKVRRGRVAQQWASIAAYRAGEAPVRTLEGDHNYAFTGRKIKKGEIFLLDARRRVVPERQMSRFFPSTFQGVDLEAEPLPEGVTMAWTIAWPETDLRSSAAKDAPLAASIGYHERLLLDPERAGNWFRVADGSGYVHRSNVRLWHAPEALGTAAAGETWLDVDLEQQTLTVMRGKTPVFATLVSSGFKSPTPRGVFRIRLKQASGTMSSSPGARDTYAVEEVPHVQYFFNSFALHSAYWHNRFGHKMSHGCVNLSPKDARTVYSVTGPHPRGGWLDAYESETDLGTAVRIHFGDEVVRDRRGDVEPVRG
ncbi:MAG: L,D-transpeptidase family protein [Nannocystaceae bacterium]|nr:L,D-transpeptidase family protein [Nannocystaceae bacterium]